MDPAIRHLIAAFRKSPNWDEQLDLSLLQRLWPALAGPMLASATTIVAIQGERVIVNVPNRVWRKELLKMKPQLLARMNEPWGAPRITEIAFTHEN